MAIILSSDNQVYVINMIIQSKKKPKQNKILRLLGGEGFEALYE